MTRPVRLLRYGVNEEREEHMSKEYVKIRLLTGDCLETATEVAKQSGIISTYDL